MIYLDNAATSFPKPQAVCEELDNVNRNYAVNAGRGSYGLAAKANTLIDEARKNIAKLVGVMMEDVFFLPSDTYAMNVIINGLNWDNQKTVYVTPFEHNAVMRPLHIIEKNKKIKIKVIPFDLNGRLQQEKLAEMFASEKPDYLFLNHASNVLGCMIPLKTIFELSKPWKPIITVDVAQTIGIVDLRLIRDYVDFLVFAGHKNLQGPIGIGGFISTSKVDLISVFAGGNGSDSLNLDMPSKGNLKYEIGSPNISAIAGLNAGIKWINAIGIEKIASHKEALIRKLVTELEKLDNIKFFKPEESDYKIGVISFIVEGYEAVDVGQILNDEFDIAVRTGHHCAPNTNIVFNDIEYGGTVRVSVGCFNTEDDILKLINAIRSL